MFPFRDYQGALVGFAGSKVNCFLILQENILAPEIELFQKFFLLKFHLLLPQEKLEFQKSYFKKILCSKKLGCIFKNFDFQCSKNWKNKISKKVRFSNITIFHLET